MFRAGYVAIAALVLSFLLVGVRPASADPACDPNTNPTADLGVVQTVTATVDANGDVASATYTIDLPNSGPCQVQAIGVTDVLPPGYATATVTSTTPAAFTCTSVTPPATSFSCSYVGSVGVPGHAQIILLVTWATAASDTTNYVSVTSTPRDPDPLNDTSYGGIATGDSKVNANLFPKKKGHLPARGQQGQQIAATASGQRISANVAFVANNADGSCVLPNAETTGALRCFGQVVRIATQQDGGEMLFVFAYSFDALPAAARAARLQDLTIGHRDPVTNTLVPLADCPTHGPAPTRGCVESRAKVSDNALGVFYLFGVRTWTNDDWGGLYP